MRTLPPAFLLTSLLVATGCGPNYLEGGSPADFAGRVPPQDDGGGGGQEDQGGGGGDGNPCQDQDGDGYGVGCAAGPDCNDGDPSVYPKAPELCEDGKDNNCNGMTDEPGCGCALGSSRECYSGPGNTAGLGVCRKGTQRCGLGGVWGKCEGEVLPENEQCDNIDNNCNGTVDEGQTNACGACGPLPKEVCSDSLDNDCNGQIDDGCNTCDPQCQCMGGQCTCSPPINQPCYSGAPQTAGVGLCRAGKHDCVKQMDGSYKWSACSGEVLPEKLGKLVCDGMDRNCDGRPDDGPGCQCLDGASRSCWSDVGECKKGKQSCQNNQWTMCVGGQGPVAEICDGKDNDCDSVVDEGVSNACGGCGPVPAEKCGDSLDNNCNGRVDEPEAKCSCDGKMEQPCYRGPVNTRGVGACKDGLQTCFRQEIGEEWGACMGDVLPQLEACGDRQDNDCDGLVDEDCGACKEAATRPCGQSLGECKPGVQTCTNGQWSACVGGAMAQSEACDGKDNDCDGLVDEGVVNACGKCPPAPCWIQDYSKPSQCNQPGRTCAGVVPDPKNPDAITLGETQGGVFPFIYISVTDKGEVAQLNTDTGQKIWQKPSYGVYPSRTAVALDGTVWVGNRCMDDRRDNDLTCSSMVHLDLNGNLICRADIPSWVRGVAIDADGHVWAGTWKSQLAWKVSGTDRDANQNPPRCKILGSVAVGVPVYGLAVDGRGFLWTASSPTVKVNTKTLQVVDRVNHGNFYGVAIDKQNRVWFGNDGVHRIDGDPPYNALRTNITGGYYAITVHPDGSIWGARYGGSGGVFKITLNQNGDAVQNIQYFGDPEGTGNHGIAVDKVGKLWSPQITAGFANRWSINGQREARFPVDPGRTLYTYSDMTGIQLRTITTREGIWLQNFDSGYGKPVWDHAEWSATVPNGTSVAVRVRAGDDQAAFSNGKATPWCGPFAMSPGAFNNCGFLNDHRWLQVEVKLATTVDGVKPSVAGVKVFWSY